MKIFHIWSALFVLLLPGMHLRAMPTVSAGGSHSCAILSGNLYCWGANYNGQIGTGNKTNALRPVRIAHPQNHAWIGVSAGYFHTCAVDDTSAAYCWGSNGKGQLGNGTTDDALTPTHVLNPGVLTPLDKVTDISASVGSCAVVDGKIACWGPNDAGQLGNNSTSPSRLPVLLSNPPRVAAISSGGVTHACSITDTEQLFCWGDNYFGQLGDGTTNDSVVPLHVFDHILAVTVATNVTCAISFARAVGNRMICWGDNYYGQLGNNSNTSSKSPIVVLDPTGTSALADVTRVSLGEFSACAIDVADHAYCWGFNGYGQLGNGTLADSTLPVAVKNSNGDVLSQVLEISMGYRHACARKPGDVILCWGKDEGGGLGDGETGDRLLPVEIDFDEIFRSGFEQN